MPTTLKRYRLTCIQKESDNYYLKTGNTVLNITKAEKVIELIEKYKLLVEDATQETIYKFNKEIVDYSLTLKVHTQSEELMRHYLMELTSKLGRTPNFKEIYENNTVLLEVETIATICVDLVDNIYNDKVVDLE